MDRQPFTRCPCTDCEAAWLEWAEIVHDAEVLSRQDCITESQWRAEFASWVDSDPESRVA